jgi:uncharacterized phosphosugar-binding protein
MTVARPAAGARPRALGDVMRGVCAGQPDAMVTIGGPDSPVGPGPAAGAVAIVNATKVRTVGLLVERGAELPVVTRSGAVGTGRSGTQFDEAHREHPRRAAGAIDQPGGG